LDLEKEHFHQLVSEGYQQVRERFKDRYFIVDGNRPLEAIVNDAITIIKSKVK
jgi:dTMP kinase